MRSGAASKSERRSYLTSNPADGTPTWIDLDLLDLESSACRQFG
jgi:hypothetical protein